MQQDSSTSAPQTKQHQIHFKGAAFEYFKIWIVNLCLTVLTLGIYSAWAKVRNRRYIYGNLELAGSNFDYHANPLSILKGRLIIGAFSILWLAGGTISPVIPIIAALGFWMLFPWIIVKALRFNLKYTSYRNIRFKFNSDFKTSYTLYFKCALMYIFTFGLGVPYVMQRHTQFRINHSQYGKEPFRFTANVRQYYEIMAAVFFAFLLALAAAFAITYFMGVSMDADSNFAKIAPLITVFFIYGGMFFATAYVRATIFNLTADTTSINKINFNASIPAFGLMGIYFTNLLGLIFSLGLAAPWAIIRTLKYKLRFTAVNIQEGTLDGFIAAAHTDDDSAVGDSAADFWDIDLGF